jgi:hypothetical protein
MIYINAEVLIDITSILLTLLAIPVFGVYILAISTSFSVITVRALCAFWIGGTVGVLIDLDHIWVAVQKGYHWYNVLAWITQGGRPFHWYAVLTCGMLLWAFITCFIGFFSVKMLYK